MIDNEIKIGSTHIIINGGNPLPGCPENWEEAREWLKKVNGERFKESRADFDVWDGPVWSFDCGFKLDYDGSLVWMSSRFYPPKDGYGPKWDGNVSIEIMGEIIIIKEFETNTLDELYDQVEQYKNKVMEKIKSLIKKEIFIDL